MIHLDALSVDFNECFQLLDIDWTLRPGEHWLITGANGSGKSALAAVLAEQRDMLEEVIEPFLLQTGLLMRTPRGRCLSVAGWAHLDMTPPPSATRQLDMLGDLGPDDDD